MQAYQVALEVAGHLAMFSRPDTGGAPTSYPAPTWSAAKSIFESVTFFRDGRAWINPTKVEICRRVGEVGGHVRFQRYTTNYGGPLRKASLFRKGMSPGGSSMQLSATMLVDVCYRLHGEVIGPRSVGGVNAKHYLQDLFNRRIVWRNPNKGGCHRTPALGWSECSCSYWGPPRCRELAGPDGVEENAAWRRYCATWGIPFADQTEVDDAISQEIPSMLIGMWNRSIDGEFAPSFGQNVEIRNGALVYEGFSPSVCGQENRGNPDVE